MARKKLKNKTCVYCGVHPAAAEDHVVPRCLFVPPLPPDTVKVPVCEDCNGKKSRDDDFLRDMLAFDRDCCEHPVAKALMGGKITRSMEKNKSVIARDVVRKSEPVWLKTPSGIYFEEAFLVPLDSDRVCSALSTIARGLYYPLSGGQRFPDGCDFDVKRVRTDYAIVYFEKLQEAGLKGPFRIGDAFGCLFAYHLPNPGRALWYMWFYDGYFTLISSKPRETASGEENGLRNQCGGLIGEVSS